MSEDISVDITMDLKGLKCPLPIVKVSQQMKKMNIGQVLVAETTDPGAHADFPAYAKSCRGCCGTRHDPALAATSLNNGR